MKKFTPELIASAKAAKSLEELRLLAKENNIDLTEAEADEYFNQLHTNGEMSDDELDTVAGGKKCGEDQLTVNGLPEGTRVQVINGKCCPQCGTTIGFARRILRREPIKMLLVEAEIYCIDCKMVIENEVYESEIIRL